MSKTVNKIISFITCVLYAWLYGAAAYWASNVFFWNSETWSREIPLLSDKAMAFFDVFFIYFSSGEETLVSIIAAILAVLVAKTLACVFQKELSNDSKAKILIMNFIYLFSVMLFIGCSGNKIVGAIMAVICAVCLGFAIFVNIKTDDGKEENAQRPERSSSVLCVISAAVYILFGIYFIIINAENSGAIKSDIFSEYYVIMFGALVLYTLIRAVYLAVNKSLPSSYKVKTLVGAGLVIPASLLAIYDGGSKVLYFIRASLFLAALIFTLYTQFEFIKDKKDKNIDSKEITY